MSPSKIRARPWCFLEKNVVTSFRRTMFQLLILPTYMKKTHVWRTMISWNFDFSACKTASTSYERHTPGKASVTSLNHPDFRAFISNDGRVPIKQSSRLKIVPLKMEFVFVTFRGGRYKVEDLQIRLRWWIRLPQNENLLGRQLSMITWRDPFKGAPNVRHLIMDQVTYVGTYLYYLVQVYVPLKMFWHLNYTVVNDKSKYILKLKNFFIQEL